jgi:hypothetical protein
MVTRAAWFAAAALLLAGIVLLRGSTKGSSASSDPPAVPEVEASAIRSSEVPAARRRDRSDAQPIVADAQADPATPAQADPATPAGATPAMGGMVIGIDPETGKLGMPTREQLKELSDLEQQRIDHTPADLVEVHHPDGSVSVDLQGRFQEFVTIRIGPDGKRIVRCVDGRENAERVLETPAGDQAEGATAEDVSAPRPASEER